jgi:uncharacterized membrane protein
MRIRVTVAAVSGALALSAFAVPAAQADDAASRADVAKIREVGHAASSDRAGFSTSAAATGEPYAMDVTFSNLKIASAIKVGTTNQVTVPVTYTMTHGADVDITAEDFFTDPYIYRGSFDAPDNILFGNELATCVSTSSTTATCKGTIDIYPAYGELINSDAGTWKAGALAIALNGQDPSSDSFDVSQVGFADQGDLASTKVQRYSKLTVNAAPEPIAKGKTLTATGKLTRANWETNTYKGYTSQPVKLQFRKAGTSTYTTVKTVYSDSYGNVKATATANYDGYWRFRFEGTTTTPAVSATGDYVDVQ